MQRTETQCGRPSRRHTFEQCHVVDRHTLTRLTSARCVLVTGQAPCWALGGVSRAGGGRSVDGGRAGRWARYAGRSSEMPFPVHTGSPGRDPSSASLPSRPGLSPGEARTLRGGGGSPPSSQARGTSPVYPPRCAVRGAGPARPSSQTPISPHRVLKSPSFPYCFGVLPAVLTELPQTAESRRGFFLPHRLAARPDASESLITRALRCTERGAVPAQSTRETLTRDQLVTESRTMTPVGVQRPRHETPRNPPLPPLPAEGTSGRERGGPLPGSGSLWSPSALGRL